MGLGRMVTWVPVCNRIRVCLFLALTSGAHFLIKAAEFDVGKRGQKVQRAQNTSTPGS